VRSYVITLTSTQATGAPLLLDGYFYVDPTGSTIVYPDSADGSLFTTTTGTFTYPFTAYDGLFIPWGYEAQNSIKNINVGTLKGPYTIIFSPAGLDVQSFGVSKIIYNFGDGETRIVERDIQDTVAGIGFGLTDPSSVDVPHDYYPEGYNTTFNPSVSVVNGNLITDVYNITFTLAPASIYELDNIHLLSNTQANTGLDETVNVLEIRNPNYLANARVLSAADSLYANRSIFDPYDYGTPILWLDASDSTTIYKDIDNRVRTWIDKSTYRYSFVQSNTANQPLYLTPRQSISNRKCIYFAATGISGDTNAESLSSVDGIAILPITDSYSAFFVCKPINTIGQVITQESLSSKNVTIAFEASNSITVYQGGVSATFSNISTNLSSYSLFSVVLSSLSSVYITADSQSTAITGLNTTTQTLTTAVVVGPFIQNEMSEILIYNTALNNVSIAAVQDYLANKWDLTLQTN
jgi:hypothetical protein